jgi:hypothetical protein
MFGSSVLKAIYVLAVHINKLLYTQVVRCMSSTPAIEQTEQPLPPPFEGLSKAEVVRQRWKAKLKYKQQKELLGKVSAVITRALITLSYAMRQTSTAYNLLCRFKRAD